MKYLLIISITVLCFTSCSEQQNNDSKEGASKETSMTNNMDNSKPVQPDEKKTTDNENTGTNSKDVQSMKIKSVVEEMIAAAKNKDLEKLKSLCSPDCEKNKNGARLCKMQSGSKEATAFETKFANAKISDDINISDVFADVPVRCGTSQNDKELIHMELIRDKWYIASLGSKDSNK
jgi:hypothetical protein